MKKLILVLLGYLTGITACTSQAVGYTDISAEEFSQKMSETNVVVLDVRTPEEIAEGKIEGAAELDFKNPNFAQEIEKLDKSKTYLVYCRSGNRSSQACKLMAEKGFDKLYNLSGGYLAWTKQ